MTPTEELIRSVDQKLALLLMEKDDLKRAVLGDSKTPGLADDVSDIKKLLAGDPMFQTEGLVAKVNRMDEFHKKFKYMGTILTTMVFVGGAIGSFLTWAVHKFDKIKEIF